MNGKLYLNESKEPVAILDSLEIVRMNDNHQDSPERIFYRTKRLNPGKKMSELYRDVVMRLELEDGRSANVLIQHSSLSGDGEFVGVLRVVDQIAAKE